MNKPRGDKNNNNEELTGVNDKNIYNQILNKNGFQIKSVNINKEEVLENKKEAELQKNLLLLNNVESNERAVKKTRWFQRLLCCVNPSVSPEPGGSEPEMGNGSTTPVVPFSTKLNNNSSAELDMKSLNTSQILLQQYNSQSSLTTPPAAVSLPTIHKPKTHQVINQRNFGDIDEVKLQNTMTQLSGLISPNILKENNHRSYFNSPEVRRVSIQTNFTEQNGQSTRDSEGNLRKYTQSDTVAAGLGSREISGSAESVMHISKSADARLMTSEPITVHPGAVRTDTLPSTSSSNSTDMTSFNQGDSYKINGIKTKQALHARRVMMKKSASNNATNKQMELSKPFERPKDVLLTCFEQLESLQWEVTMLGLTALLRLVRHHPALVLSQLHPLVVAVAKHIKNLRSQIARAACQVSVEMFTCLKKNMETDVEELAAPLFHRSADTNKFIRGDCNTALDHMIDTISPAKVIPVIISKGAIHQNAIVRSVAARLFVRLTEKLGPDKVLRQPREIRDKMLVTGASLLTEGSLETRNYAKDLFRLLATQPMFATLMTEAVPANLMRHISKTLAQLK